MPPTLPVEMRVTEEPDGSVAYEFPPRELGKWRWVAVIPIVGGLGAISFIAFWSFGFISGLTKVFGPWGGLAGLFALPFLVGALSLIAVGFAMAIGRARLVLTERHLVVIEKIGWFPWRRRVPRGRITRLTVMAGNFKRAGESTDITPVSPQFAALMAESPNGKPQVLVVGYARDWLVPVAHDLSARLAIDSSRLDEKPQPVPVTVVESSTTDAGEFERLEQPEGSLIELQSLEEGCIFTIPARGVWKGSGGLFGFSLLWCGFMTIFTSLVIFGVANGHPRKDGSVWVFPLFIILFWAVGIGILLASINMGRRQAAIAVADGRMKTIVSGLFGVTRKEWELLELETVRKGPSGMEVNDVPVMQLHIVPREGKPYGLLTGRDDAELEWIATHLRRHVSSVDEPA